MKSLIRYLPLLLLLHTQLSAEATKEATPQTQKEPDTQVNGKPDAVDKTDAAENTDATDETDADIPESDSKTEIPKQERKKSQYKPLFDIDIEHEFKNPKEAFEETRQLILDNYYSNHITEKALYWAAIHGMLRHVSPPEHPELGAIWTPPQYGKVSEALRGEQISLGIRSSFNGNDGSLTVNSILPGSPAENILQPLDRILRIDGKALRGLPVNEIDGMMNGEVGSSVELTIVRDIKAFTINLTREKFKVVNLETEILSDNIGYVRIKSFAAGISDELGEKVEQMHKMGVTKLILDLRNNGGGVFVESMRVAEIFLPKTKILLRTLTQSEGLRNYVSASPESKPLSIAVLVNQKTASSCEILAAALRDHGIGMIVGTKTYGKGVYEKTFTLKNDYRVKFIVGAMYSPLGKSWQTKGLIPDFASEVDDNTFTALMGVTPKERLKKDVPMITAYKLLLEKK
ncbi:MAG: S41 family peptidase [Planctomycetota bacterium]|nr:S41 family peptidase [Planctomycetota bacterium]MDA1137697.1 S41 family peptidase [Planctomycetota bacterium]